MIASLKSKPPAAANPNMQDVADAAGVGVATVDRVINRRAPVRPETARRVLAAAQRLGFQRAGLIRHQIENSLVQIRLGVVLQKKSAHFYAELAQALAAAAQDEAGVACDLTIEYLDELTPQHMVSRLMALSTKVDALAVVAADHPQISQAIDQLALSGIPVFALVSELTATSCAGYIGIDQRKVGRMAAWSVANLSKKPGKVGLLVGSHRYLCQEQNEISFRGYFREYAPAFRVLETLVSLEEPALAQAATMELIKQHPDLKAIYVAGGGVEGVIEGIRQSVVPSALVAVCHDLTATTRQALIDGQMQVVLSHPLQWMASRLIERMAFAVKGKGKSGSPQIILPFNTFTVANL